MQEEHLPIYHPNQYCIRTQSNESCNKSCYTRGYIFKVKFQCGMFVEDTKCEAHNVENIRPCTQDEIKYYEQINSQNVS
jgi:hypothetical protein